MNNKTTGNASDKKNASQTKNATKNSPATKSTERNSVNKDSKKDDKKQS